jgi:hypothetical protein
VPPIEGCRLPLKYGAPPVASWLDLNVDDLPPWLHGHCPASSLLRGSPSLSGASVLLASRVLRLCLVWALCCQAFSEQRSLFLAFFVGFFVRSGIPFLRPDPQYCKAGARRSCQGWPSHRPFQVLCPCQAHALTAPSTAAQSMSRDDDWRGAPLSVARINRATTLYAVGPGTRTMMHSCASAAVG